MGNFARVFDHMPLLRNIDNELLGDPLDVKMFEFTRWNYKEDSKTTNPIVFKGNDSYEVNKEFEF